MVTQADIARAIPSLRDAGVPVERIRVPLERDAVAVALAAEREKDEPNDVDRLLVV